jgi:putative hydrolase of the HAD superfamily
VKGISLGPKTPALIFDFGNVIAFFDYRRAAESWGRPLGMTGEAFLEHARSVGFAPLVRDYESGKMSTAEFSSRVRSLAALDISHAEFAAGWTDIFALNEPIEPVIANLKRQGYRLVLGSNTNELHATQFRSQFPTILAHFDRLVLSFEVGFIKPSLDFYLACARAAAAAPAECVFIDDLDENVEGAREAGLTGLVFRDVETLVDDLAKLGVHIRLNDEKRDRR